MRNWIVQNTGPGKAWNWIGSWDAIGGVAHSLLILGQIAQQQGRMEQARKLPQTSHEYKADPGATARIGRPLINRMPNSC